MRTDQRAEEVTVGEQRIRESCHLGRILIQRGRRDNSSCTTGTTAQHYRDSDRKPVKGPVVSWKSVGQRS